jgi:hypothetical protein
MLGRLSVLLVAAGLLIIGGANLLVADQTRDAGAGALLGAGLVIIGAWVWDEIRRP